MQEYKMAFIEAGWFEVETCGITMFTKNGMWWVFHQKSSVKIDSNLFKQAAITQYPKRCKWHLEKNGWLIKKGTTFDYTGESVSISESCRKKIEEFTALADATEEELAQFCQREVAVPKMVERLIAVPTTKSFAETKLLRLKEDFEINNWKPNTVYQFSGAANDYLLFTALDDALMIETSEVIVKESQFLKMAENKMFEVVEPVMKLVEEFELEMQLRVPFPTTKVSSCYDKFKLDKLQRVWLSCALAQKLNPTVFLDRRRTPEELCALLKLEISSKQSVELADVLMNAEAIEELTKIAENGYSIKMFVAANSSASYVRQQFADMMQVADTMVTELNVAPEVKAVVKRLVMMNINPASVIEATDNKFKVLLKAKYKDVAPKLVNFLVTNGVTTNSLYSSWFGVPPEAKLEMRSMLAVDATIWGHSWLTCLERITQEAQLVVIDENYSLALQYNGFLIARENNSVVVFDSNGSYYWRATEIGGDVFVEEIKDNTISSKFFSSSY